MSLKSWITGHMDGEKLVAKAIAEFAAGDSKDATANLIQGLIELAPAGRAKQALQALQADLQKFLGIGALATPATTPGTK
jgi:hypothetical protein